MKLQLVLDYRRFDGGNALQWMLRSKPSASKLDFSTLDKQPISKMIRSQFVDILKKEDIAELLDKSSDTFVSIYMPTHRVGREQQQDPTRLKNLLARAEEELKERGLRTPEAQAILAPGESLLANPDFWQHQSDGLALFMAQGYNRSYRLPHSFEELLRINQRFHTKPLLPLLSHDNQFYILGLSQSGIRLYLATRYVMDSVDLSGVPTSVEEALWFDDPEKHLHYHTSTESPVSTSGERPAVYHGHGVTDEQKVDILRFFQRLDRSLNDILGSNSIPLVLAGVEYLLPIYHEANTYPHLLEKGIPLNIDELEEDQIHSMAWEIVSPIFEKDREEARNVYLHYVGENSQLASDELKLAVQAAYFEAVDTLFVPLGMQVWGSFDPQKSETSIHDQPQPGDTDLLDFTAMHTLKNSGTVYTVQPEDVPGGGRLAAIFRYEYAPA